MALEDSGGVHDAILFIHGWRADRSVWRDVIAALGDDVRSIAVDLCGSGDSRDASGPYTLERFAADLRELIQSLAIGPLVIVGHSMGATVALRLAVDAPNLVRGLILIAPIPASGAAFSEKGEAYLRATADDPVTTKGWLARTMADPSNAVVLDRLCVAAVRTPPNVALESFPSWAHADFAQETTRIAAPTLVIAPERDLPENAEMKVARLISGARCVVLSGAAHYVIAEHPKKIAEMIREFMAKLRLRSP